MSNWFQSNLTRMYLTMGRWLNLLPDNLTSSTTVRTWATMAPHDRYKILRAYYDSNDLYAVVQTALEERASVKHPLLSIRNPTHQVVEFYVTNLWRGQLPDALKIEAAKADIVPAIHQIWNWSNWGTVKQKAARWLARDGDLFNKVAQNGKGNRVFFQLIDALLITDFDKNDRENLSMIRIDIPHAITENKRTRVEWTTELWEKEADRFRRWRHDKGESVAIDDLPTPIDDAAITQEFGFDFLPFVHTPFIDVGKKYGQAAIEPALDKIDEANRKATRMSKQLFRHNDVTWAIESEATDSQGRPLAPPQTETLNSDGEEIVEVGGERFLKLPSSWHLKSTVPDIKYEAALSILQDDMKEMERELPELTYFRLRDQELSGRAIRLKLGEAIARAEEVQGNALEGLVRAHKMALTIGQLAGIEGFDAETIGTYDGGQFDHTIDPPDILPAPKAERAETLATLVQSGIPVTVAMRMLKFPDDEIAEVDAELASQRAQAQQERAQAALQALRDIQTQQNGQQTQTEPEVIA